MIHYAKNWAILAGLDQSKEHKDSINIINPRVVHWETVCLSKGGSLFPCISPRSWTRKLSFSLFFFSSLHIWSTLIPGASREKLKWTEQVTAQIKAWEMKKQSSMSVCVWRDRGRRDQAGMVSKAEQRGRLLLMVGMLEVAVGLEEGNQEQLHHFLLLLDVPDYLVRFFSIMNSIFFFFAMLSIKSIAKRHIHKHFFCRLHMQVIIALWYNKGERFHLIVLHFMRSGWKSFSTYFLSLIFSATCQVNKTEWWCLSHNFPTICIRWSVGNDLLLNKWIFTLVPAH